MRIEGKSIYYGRCAGGVYFTIADDVFKDDAEHVMSKFMSPTEFLSFAHWVSMVEMDMLREAISEEDK